MFNHAFIDLPLLDRERRDRLREDSVVLEKLWPQSRVLLLDREGNVLSQASADRPWLLCGQDLGNKPKNTIFLGFYGISALFAVDKTHISSHLPDTAQWIGLRQAGMTWASQPASIFSYARSLHYWQSRNQFCGVCGGGIVFERGGMLARCEQCGSEHYPRVDPAIIVSVANRGRLLLGRQPHWEPHRYSILAGFVEPGETFEQAVAREVREETQVQIKNLRYVASQPWPFPSALMVGFHANGFDDVPTVNGELEDARWFSAQEISAALDRETRNDKSGITLPPRLSIARTLIELWLKQRNGR